MRYFIPLALLLTYPTTALAGAWPRAEGERVIGFSVNGQTQGIWAEAGLKDSRWLAFKVEELGHDVYRARLALLQGFAWGDWVFAVGLGGQIDHLRLEPWASDGGYMASSFATSYHLNVGRGLQWPLEGWVNADIRHDRGDLAIEDQIDTTFGLKISPQWSVMSQLTLSRRNGGKVYRRLAPSMLWQGSSDMNVELGVSHDVDGADGTRLKLGTWFNF